MSDIVESLLPKYRINYPEHESSFSEALSSFFTRGEYLDVIFICKGNQLLHAHKTVLASVSDFLSQTFRSCGQDIVHISLPDVEHKKLQIVLSFLYEGITKVNLNELAFFKDILSFLDIRVLNAEIKPISTISVASGNNSAVQTTVPANSTASEMQNQFTPFTPENVSTGKLYTLLIPAQPSSVQTDSVHPVQEDNHMEVEPLLEENTAGLKIKNVSSCSTELLESLWRVDDEAQAGTSDTSQNSQTVTMFRDNQTVTMTFHGTQGTAHGQQFPTSQTTSAMNEEMDPLDITAQSVKTEVIDESSNSNISLVSDAAVNTSPSPNQTDAIIGTMPQIFQASINDMSSLPSTTIKNATTYSMHKNLIIIDDNQRLTIMSDKSSSESNTVATSSSYNMSTTSLNDLAVPSTSGKNAAPPSYPTSQNVINVEDDKMMVAEGPTSGTQTAPTNPYYKKPSGDLYKCIKCSQSFLSEEDLQNHAVFRPLIGSCMYQCCECKKMFTQKKNLNRHRQSFHPLHLTYRCDLCGKSYENKFSLNKHFLVHTEGQQLTCEMCQRTYSRKHDYDLHIHSHSLPLVEYRCDMCNKLYLNKYNLNRHKAAAHKKIAPKS